MQNFFSYPIIVDTLPAAEQRYKLRTDKEDCAKIRDILQIPDVKSFSADINLKYDKKERLLKLWGHAEAELELESVVSLNLFLKKYATDFNLLYDTKATLKSQHEEEEEINIDDNLPEIVINGKIDLADIAIEQIALVMEDHPRQEGEVFEFKASFNPEDDRKNPFEILKKLQ